MFNICNRICSLKSIAFGFSSDRDLTSDGERRIALSHDSRIRNPVTITSLEKFKFEVGKSLNNQDFDVPVRNVEASKSSSGSYRQFDTYDRAKAMMERKTRYEARKNCLLQNMKQMAV